MEAQVSKVPHPLMWAAGIAVVVFSAVGTAAIMGWIPTSIGHPTDSVAPATLEKPQANMAKPVAARAHDAPRARTAPPPPVPMAQATPAPVRCAECGVIESTREVQAKGEGSGLGIAGGAVVGGVLGHQVGSGNTKKVATVIGAVGGAMAGNEVEKRVRTTNSYDVTVRMDDGSSRVIHQASAPAWRTGEHVKVVDGAIRAN